MRPACPECGRHVGHELDCKTWAASVADMPQVWEGDDS